MMPAQMQGNGMIFIVIAVAILAAFGYPMVTEFTKGNVVGGLILMSKFFGWLLVGYLLSKFLMYMADENFGCRSKNLMAAILGVLGLILVLPVILVGVPWMRGKISDWRDRKKFPTTTKAV